MTSLSKVLRYGFVSTMTVILLAACASADRPSLLSTPTTARPRPIQETSANMGSLYPANSGGPYINAVSHRPLFEDRRARNVGDTLTVLLNETGNPKAG
jgi:flagellar L-ring protein precursor FlgH